MIKFVKWSLSCLAVTAFVFVGFHWLDRPFALFCQSVFGRFEFLNAFSETPGFFGPLLLLCIALLCFRHRIQGPTDNVLVPSAISIILSYYTVKWLKYAVGRSWPKFTSPSLIYNHVYSFNPFQGGAETGYASFPSGHAAAVFAVISVLWPYAPRLRPAFAAIAGTLAIGLVVANYHYLSDVVAGAFIGATTGLLAIKIGRLISIVGLRGSAKRERTDNHS